MPSAVDRDCLAPSGGTVAPLGAIPEDMMDDKLPPILKGMTIPKTVDLDKSVGTLRIEVQAGDDAQGSGVSVVRVLFNHSIETASGSLMEVEIGMSPDQDNFFDDSPETAVGLFDILRTTTHGLLEIVQVAVVDFAGNLTIYNQSELLKLGLSTSLEILAPGPVANRPPTAQDFNINAAEDSPVIVPLPAATDPDGDTITFAVVSGPLHGTATISADRSLRYAPSLNYFGADSLSYSVSDGRGGSNTYAVVVNVTAANDAPTGTLSITGSAQLGQQLGLSNLLADVDGLGTFSYQWLRGGAALNGATQSIYVLTQPDVGSTISVRVSYVDGGGTLETVTSGSTAVVAGFTAVTGTATADSLTGSVSPDLISGLAGNDSLTGLAGNDSLLGGDGNDLLNGGTGNDTLHGGAGLDIADYRGAATANANLLSGVATQGADSDTLISIEAIFGSSAADVLRGFDGVGNAGETLRGNGGNDSIDGGTGVDTAEFNANLADYTINRTPGTMNIVVTHKNGGADGVDALSNIEHLQFADRIVAFGPRAEDVARVAFALWTPAIYASQTLFSKGISFYDNEFNYSFDVLCQVALQYHPGTAAELAAKLKASIPASSYSEAQLLAIINASGSAAAVKAVALDPATTQQLELTGVTTKGVVATLNFDAEMYFGLLPG